MSLSKQDMHGTEIAGCVRDLTRGWVQMGPGTLYTILSNFQKEGLIQKTSSRGGKIIYALTARGRTVYENEVARLRQCLADAESKDQL